MVVLAGQYLLRIASFSRDCFTTAKMSDNMLSKDKDESLYNDRKTLPDLKIF